MNGLEQRYGGEVEFIYLDVSNPEVRPAMEEFGFVATPHFFLRGADGTVAWSRQGRVSEREMVDAIEAVTR